jgi:drug/metabolite transporter (DMT)-like permease
MLEGLAFGLSAALAWGLTDISAALAARRIGGLATVAGVQLIGFVVLFAFALVTQGAIPFDPAVAPQAVALGILAAAGYVSFFTALGRGPIAVVSPVGSAYGGLTVVLAVVLLGEQLSPTQAIGAALGTVGILTVALRVGPDWRATRFVGPGVPFAVVSLVLWAFVTIGTTVSVREAGVLPVILVARAANMTTVWCLVGLRRAFRPHDLPSRRSITRRVVGLTALAGILDVTGYIIYATGLERSLAWLVGLTSSFGPAIAVLVAVGFLGDRLRPVQWLGLAALALGVVLIGFR